MAQNGECCESLHTLLIWKSKFILEYKRYSQKFPEEHLYVICSETGDKMEELILLGRNDFIAIFDGIKKF